MPGQRNAAKRIRERGCLGKKGKTNYYGGGSERFQYLKEVRGGGGEKNDHGSQAQRHTRATRGEGSRNESAAGSLGMLGRLEKTRFTLGENGEGGRSKGWGGEVGKLKRGRKTNRSLWAHGTVLGEGGVDVPGIGLGEETVSDRLVRQGLSNLNFPQVGQNWGVLVSVG